MFHPLTNLNIPYLAKKAWNPIPYKWPTIYKGVTIKYKKLPPLDGTEPFGIHKRRIFMRYRQNIYYCPVALQPFVTVQGKNRGCERR